MERSMEEMIYDFWDVGIGSFSSSGTTDKAGLAFKLVKVAYL